MARIEIFRTGTHQPMNGPAISFAASDLAASAAAYDPAVHEAPAVVGHPKTDDPAWAWVKKIDITGDRMFAELDQVAPAFAEQVKAGRYKKISASFYTPNHPSNPVPGVYYLRHVGFLGAQAPAVKGLSAVSFSDEQEDQLMSVEFSIAEPAAEPVLAQAPDKSADNSAANNAAIKKKEAELLARENALQLAEAAFAETMHKEADASRRKQFGEKLESIVATGRVLPLPGDQLVEFMAALDDQAVVNFAEGDLTMAGVFGKILDALPVSVDFSEKTSADHAAVDFAELSATQISEAITAEQHRAEQTGITLTVTEALARVKSSMKG